MVDLTGWTHRLFHRRRWWPFHAVHRSSEKFAGLLPFGVILLGTNYIPKGRYPENFGIHDPMPNRFPGHKWVPFMWKRHKLKADRPIEPIPSGPSPARAN